jgi:hypothetical protein
MVLGDKKMRDLAEQALLAASQVVLSTGAADGPAVLERRGGQSIRRFLDAVIRQGTPALARDGKRLQGDLERAIGKTAVRAVGRKRRAPSEPVLVRPEQVEPDEPSSRTSPA